MVFYLRINESTDAVKTEIIALNRKYFDALVRPKHTVIDSYPKSGPLTNDKSLFSSLPIYQVCFSLSLSFSLSRIGMD